MEMTGDSGSLKMPKPEVLGVLYRTALVRRDLGAFSLHGGFWLERIKLAPRLLWLMVRAKQFERAATDLRFELPRERNELQECLRGLEMVFQKQADLLELFKQRGLEQALFEGQVYSFLRAIEARLGEARANWRALLAPDTTSAPHYQLEDLVGQITLANRHELVNWGGPVGKEIW